MLPRRPREGEFRLPRRPSTNTMRLHVYLMHLLPLLAAIFRAASDYSRGFGAAVDYIALNGQEELFVKAILQWSWATMDKQALVKKYAEVPPKMRPKTE